MGIFDYAQSGRMDIYGESEQTDINHDNIISVNKQDLLNSIGKRSSKFDIIYYIDSLNYLVEMEFWTSVLIEVIRTYNMSVLTNLLSPSFNFHINIKEDTIELLKYIKITVIEKLLHKEVGHIENPEEFRTEFSVFGEIPKLLDYFLKYTDSYGYNYFLNRIKMETQSSK